MFLVLEKFAGVLQVGLTVRITGGGGLLKSICILEKTDYFLEQCQVHSKTEWKGIFNNM